MFYLDWKNKFYDFHKHTRSGNAIRSPNDNCKLRLFLLEFRMHLLLL